MKWSGSKHYNRAQRLLKKQGNRIYYLKNITSSQKGTDFISAFHTNAKQAKEAAANAWNGVKFENLKVLRSNVMSKDEIIMYSDMD